METEPPSKSTYEFLQKDIRNDVSKLENASSAEEAAPYFEPLLQKLRSIDLKSVGDSKTLHFLHRLLSFSSFAVARYAPPELRKDIQDFQNNARARAWEVFVGNRKARGIQEPDAIPSTFDSDFGPYIVAASNFTQTPEEAIERDTEILNKIITENLPADLTIVDSISQQLKEDIEICWDRLANSLPNHPHLKDLPGYAEYIALADEARKKIAHKQHELMVAEKK